MHVWFIMNYILCMMWQSGLSFSFFHMVIQHHLLKTFLSPMNSFGGFIENQLTIWVSFWILFCFTNVFVFPYSNTILITLTLITALFQDGFGFSKFYAFLKILGSACQFLSKSLLFFKILLVYNLHAVKCTQLEVYSYCVLTVVYTYETITTIMM